jgi:hypothetical protein
MLRARGALAALAVVGQGGRPGRSRLGVNGAGTGWVRRRMYCWPTLQKLVVTQ